MLTGEQKREANRRAKKEFKETNKSSRELNKLFYMFFFELFEKVESDVENQEAKEFIFNELTSLTDKISETINEDHLAKLIPVIESDEESEE